MTEEGVGIKIGIGEVEEEPGAPKVIIELSEALTWWAWDANQAVVFALKIIEAAASIPRSSLMKMEGDLPGVGVVMAHKGSTRIH